MIRQIADQADVLYTYQSENFGHKNLLSVSVSRVGKKYKALLILLDKETN